MTTELREAMTSGVLVEFHDAQGNLQGQVVYTDWRGRPVPALGDTLASPASAAAHADSIPMRGRVVARHFQLQADEDGAPLRLGSPGGCRAVEVCDAGRGAQLGVCFSQN